MSKHICAVFPHEKVLIFLKELINSKLANVRLCVTSQPEVDIVSNP